MAESPLAFLKPLNATTDIRRKRRALSADELRFLIHHTVTQPERFGMSGRERSVLYLIATQTGLRANELRSLTRASFDLDADTPTVAVEAAYSKRRRRDVLPLRRETADLLAAFLASKAPAAPAFNLYDKRTAEMLRTDLEAARAEWIWQSSSPANQTKREESDFLRYIDGEGRSCDFNSAGRHTFVSSLAAGGVHPKTAQALARHSSIRLTMDHYTHTFRGDETGRPRPTP